MNGSLLGLTRSTLNALAHGRIEDAKAQIKSSQHLPSELEHLQALIGLYDKKHSSPAAIPLPAPLNDELNQCIAGWTHYYNADYELATAAFQKAWEHKQTWNSWTALGLGKVASDLTRWRDARRWLLETMQIARAEADLLRMAEATGALGEVFLRNSHHLPASELFALDQALLPAGSAYRSRLENYRAICLSKNGFHTLAEPTLWAAFYAEVTADSDSSHYSAASLAALSLRAKDHSLFKRLHQVIGTKNIQLTRMTAGFYSTVQAYWYWNKKDNASAANHLQKALASFSTTYPIEALWIRILLAHLSTTPPPLAKEIDILIARDHPTSTPLNNSPLSAFEAIWNQSKKLPECGIEHLKNYLNISAHSTPPWQIIDFFFI